MSATARLLPIYATAARSEAVDVGCDYAPRVAHLVRPSAKRRFGPSWPRLIRTWRTLLLAAPNVRRDMPLGIDTRLERHELSISI